MSIGLGVALFATAFAGIAQGGTTTTVLVGYQPGADESAKAAIELAGGRIERASSALGVALVGTSDADAFMRVAMLSPSIQYVESDDATRLAGTESTGSEWNGAQWNGAQWNGAQWNGAQWNGAQWNGAQWNGAQWNGAQWTSAPWSDAAPSGAQANGAQWNGPPMTDAQRLAARWTAIHRDGAFSYDESTSDPGLAWQWGTWAMGAPDAWTASAEGARLCVLDSGIAWDHPDIAPNFAEAWNAREPGASAYDDGGHGTHVAGLAAGAVGNAYGIAGVANARIYAAKVLDAQGQGLESDLAWGLEWCALRGADVAVMALSASVRSPTLDRAIAFAVESDMLLLASAGNGGGAVEFPASDPRVLAVGAVDGALALPDFSARGAELDLVAPGVNVLGPFPGASFAFGTGTSQAVALAAGVATLVRAAAPSLDAAAVATLLSASARDLGAPGHDGVYGQGLVDAENAARMIGSGSP